MTVLRLRGRWLITTCAVLLTLAGARRAAAQDADASVEAGVASGKAGSSPVPWIRRYETRAHQVELGLFAGVLLPAGDHNLREDSAVPQRFSSVAPSLGARAGYFPLSFLGAELDGSISPTSTADGGDARLWGFNGQLVLQAPFASLIPFVAAGAGMVGASSDAMGRDFDPAWHFGGGLKVAVTRSYDLRLDARTHLTQSRTTSTDAAQRGDAAYHTEVLLGFAYVIGRGEKRPPAPAPAPPPPPPPSDRDGDGLADSEDACPDQASDRADGCPPRDGDGDGVLDEDDACPAEPGDLPSGCPDPDPDGDGVAAEDDLCPDEPETPNGFEDADGCPDEVPEEVRKFEGVIPGIEFPSGKAEIRSSSRPVLDEAVRILQQYPDLRLSIVGHTDNVGSDRVNQKLSEQRAAAVKTYLVEQGVGEDRIRTRGAGSSEPIADNSTASGRRSNRRIQFEILQR